MAAARYRISVRGIAPGNNRQGVARQLARIFGLTTVKAERMLAACPVAIKSGADRRTALHYRAALRKAGCAVEVETIGGRRPVRQTRPAAAAPLKTCPKCGYSATSPDDPLLTAYGGQGECPACGAIVAKSTSADRPPGQAASPASDSAGGDAPLWARIATTIAARPAFAGLAFAVVVVAACFFYGDPSQPVSASTNRSMTARQAGDLRQNAAISPDGTGRSAGDGIVFPGQTRSAKVVLYLPYLHRDTHSPISFRPRCVVHNTWEDDGVRIAVEDISVSPIKTSLWERRDKTKNLWFPEGSPVRMSRSSVLQAMMGNDILRCDDPAKLALDPQPGMTAAAGSPERRQADYTLYRTTVELSISVPGGLAEARNVKQGLACIAITSTDIEMVDRLRAVDGARNGKPYQPGAYSLVMDQRHCIEMTQQAGRDEITFSPKKSLLPLSHYCALEVL